MKKTFLVVLFSVINYLSVLGADACYNNYHMTVTNAYYEYQDNLSSCSGFSAGHCRREAEAIFAKIADSATDTFDSCSGFSY